MKLRKAAGWDGVYLELFLKEALVNIFRKHEGTNNSLLTFMIKTIPKVRLKSSKPSWVTQKALLNSDFTGTMDRCKD